MPKISNIEYKRFIEEGYINIVDRTEFSAMLERLKHPQIKQARALFILLYYSGRRPSEILQLKAENLKKEGRYIVMVVPTLKGGRFSTLMLPHTNPHIKELWEYCKTMFPEQWLFYSFRSNHKQRFRVKIKGIEELRQYDHLARRLYYWLKKWTGLPPYFFRHNRFSDMSDKGASLMDIVHAKGAKDPKSAMAYQHLSKKRAKEIAKFIK